VISSPSESAQSPPAVLLAIIVGVAAKSARGSRGDRIGTQVEGPAWTSGSTQGELTGLDVESEPFLSTSTALLTRRIENTTSVSSARVGSRSEQDHPRDKGHQYSCRVSMSFLRLRGRADPTGFSTWQFCCLPLATRIITPGPASPAPQPVGRGVRSRFYGEIGAVRTPSGSNWSQAAARRSRRRSWLPEGAWLVHTLHDVGIVGLPLIVQFPSPTSGHTDSPTMPATRSFRWRIGWAVPTSRLRALQRR